MKFNKWNESDFIDEQFSMTVVFNYADMYIQGKVQRSCSGQPLDLMLFDWIDDKYIEIEDGRKKYIYGYYVVD